MSRQNAYDFLYYFPITFSTVHCYHAYSLAEIVQDYRLTTEQESTLESAVRVFAFVEEFSCRPPTYAMAFLTLLELASFIYTSTYLYTSYEVSLTWTGPVPYCSVLIYNPGRRWEVWRFFSYM